MTNLEKITAPAHTVTLVLDEDDPRIVTRDGEVVPLGEASTAQVGEFLADLRAMRTMLDAAIAATAGDLAVRSDAAGTRTLRAGGVTVTVGPDVEKRFALDAALADLRALLDARDPHGTRLAIDAAFDELVNDVGAIARVKVTREPDMAAIKRLRSRGDVDVNAILDRHTHEVGVARRTVKVEGA